MLVHPHGTSSHSKRYMLTKSIMASEGKQSPYAITIDVSLQSIFHTMKKKLNSWKFMFHSFICLKIKKGSYLFIFPFMKQKYLYEKVRRIDICCTCYSSWESEAWHDAFAHWSKLPLCPLFFLFFSSCVLAMVLSLKQSYFVSSFWGDLQFFFSCFLRTYANRNFFFKKTFFYSLKNPLFHLPSREIWCQKWNALYILGLNCYVLTIPFLVFFSMKVNMLTVQLWLSMEDYGWAALVTFQRKMSKNCLEWLRRSPGWSASRPANSDPLLIVLLINCCNLKLRTILY